MLVDTAVDFEFVVHFVVCTHMQIGAESKATQIMSLNNYATTDLWFGSHLSYCSIWTCSNLSRFTMISSGLNASLNLDFF